MSPRRLNPLLMLLALSLAVTGGRLHAFSLLGPFQSWMTPEYGFHGHGQLGGPMNIGEGYRWNTPVVTYGFDQSFLSYFSTNGVAAVEQAIQALNSLPAAADLNPDSFLQATTLHNSTAGNLSLVDLRSYTLAYLLQFMGLGPAAENVYVLRSAVVLANTTNYTVVQRNYDPISYVPTNIVLGSLYTYAVNAPLMFFTNNSPNPTPSSQAVETRVSGNANQTPIAGVSLAGGNYFPGELTRDDAGGLRYLLRYGNAVREPLLSDVRGTGPNATNWVNEALRPGVEKITFLRQAYNSLTGGFFPLTNRYTDAYFDGPDLKRQEVERVTTQPDILFTAWELTFNGFPELVQAADTSGWLNLAGQNGNPGGGGPGIIRPPMTLAFSTLGPNFFNFSAAGARFLDERSAQRGLSWASFGTATNVFATYPQARDDGTPTKLRLQFVSGTAMRETSWNLYGAPNSLFQLQHSLNLVNWTNSVTVTNTGVPLTYILPVDTSLNSLFYRALPQ